MTYTVIKQTKNDLESLITQIKLSGNEETIRIAKEMSRYIPEYTKLLNNIGSNGELHDISTILGIKETQILISKIRSNLFNNLIF